MYCIKKSCRAKIILERQVFLMRKLFASYRDNVDYMDSKLRVTENFDIIRRTLKIGENDEITMFYIDGLIKDESMQKIMQYFLSLKDLCGTAVNPADEFAAKHIPYVEVDVIDDAENFILAVMSGSVALLGSSFGSKGIIIDARTYPSRTTEEPENDKVMQGAKDGFVETLIFNTALIRRRIRDTSLTMMYKNVSTSSKTDVVICYMEGRANKRYVKYISDKIDSLSTSSITLGFESLAESLIKTKWYNPFPKIRTVERPDAAAAELLEGRVLIICDTSPRVMVLPTSIFDFMQETNDFYFQPITGCYLRVIRHFVFWLSLFLTPVWYLLTLYPNILPDPLLFIIPSHRPQIPIIAQLFLVEFAIDGLKIASMNTPDMLSSSLSVIGGLILGESAVKIGWFTGEVIFYMALVAIASFTQHNYELGYAFKFFRMMLLLLTWLFRIWGFAAGVIIIFLLLLSNRTINGEHSYLFPVIPFNGRAFARLFFRLKKRD